MVMGGAVQLQYPKEVTNRFARASLAARPPRALPLQRLPAPEAKSPAPPSESMRLAARRVVDLRRRNDPNAAALLCERARHLPRAERALIESVYRDGRSLSELAGVPGVSAEQARIGARRLARRIKAIVRRMTSPLFVFVVSRLERAAELGATDAWPPPRRRVAELVVLHGESVKSAARSSGLTVHAARAHLRAIEAMCAGAMS